MSFSHLKLTLRAFATSIIPTGTVTFIIDKKPQKRVRNARGQATFSTSKLPPVAHTIQVEYSGDSQYNSSISGVLKQIIEPPKCF